VVSFSGVTYVPDLRAGNSFDLLTVANDQLAFGC
jgi:hypothetical protein